MRYPMRFTGSQRPYLRGLFEPLGNGNRLNGLPRGDFALGGECSPGEFVGEGYLQKQLAIDRDIIPGELEDIGVEHCTAAPARACVGGINRPPLQTGLVGRQVKYFDDE